MSLIKFKKGDEVIVTAGKDKGKKGKIDMVMGSEQKVIIPGANVYKKHLKASVAADNKGGIYDVERPLDFAKIALICPACKKVTRIGFSLKGKEKSRICRKCKKIIK